MSIVTAQLTRLSHAVVLSWGWRRAAIAFIAGAVSVLALAPVNAWPVLFVTFPVAVWLIEGSSAGRLGGVMTAAVSGWWFGFGYFVAGLYWLGFAFLVDAKTFAWLLPFAVLGLPAALAFFFSAAFGLARAFWLRGPLRILTLAIALDRDRMAARPCAHRLSLEHDRLCAHRAAGAGAGLRADRALGADAVRRLSVRKPRGAGR